ncbi:hypothetical protein KF707_04000 [Candidatus Obscuribacterales bacterium]|nr:hypothetical protein [Candidatus Obscuribacterales bacterium]MBX3135370.1 hypothetical protein [Candidatus Obscuribacterales bacterium]MBX3149404.1 hypothetical protein [Candidatus Obscuribacterales bacterium]
MRRIAVDMDEVITDALSKHVRLYNEHFNKQVIIDEHLVGLSLREFAEEHERLKVREFVDDEMFFAEMDVLPGALETLEALSHENELFITTAAMEVPYSFRAKYEWLLKHTPFIDPMNFVFCGDKSIVQADYLIDDNVRHFKRFKGTGLLFDAPHNRYVDYNPRMIGWSDVAKFFGVSVKEKVVCS